MTDVKQAIKEMYDLMALYSEYGASDTEPRAEFAQALFDALEGREAFIPITASGWQLFSDMDGADGVARILNLQLLEVLSIANGDHRGFVQAMRYYFNAA